MNIFVKLFFVVGLCLEVVHSNVVVERRIDSNDVERVDSNYVKRIDVMTADCEDCGMSILGQLSVKVCLFNIFL